MQRLQRDGLAVIRPAYKPGEPIPTERLPRICPACGRKEITAVALSGNLLATSVHRVTCGCGWNEKYQLREEN